MAKLHNTIAENEALISELREETDKLKSVLQQKVTGGRPDILATIEVTSSSLSLYYVIKSLWICTCTIYIKLKRHCVLHQFN